MKILTRSGHVSPKLLVDLVAHEAELAYNRRKFMYEIQLNDVRNGLMDDYSTVTPSEFRRHVRACRGCQADLALARDEIETALLKLPWGETEVAKSDLSQIRAKISRERSKRNRG